MYHLTPRMTQRLWHYFNRYHDLFSGGRCQGWELEELIVKAIKDDTGAQHQVFWREAGHDDKADIKVVSDKEYLIQIKSGRLKEVGLILSGYRLGRFKGDLVQMTDYLNNLPADFIAVPYSQEDADQGRKHIYEICYVGKNDLQHLDANRWQQVKGRQGGLTYSQTNALGVELKLHPSMSWQVWWTIPYSIVERSDRKVIG